MPRISAAMDVRNTKCNAYRLHDEHTCLPPPLLCSPADMSHLHTSGHDGPENDEPTYSCEILEAFNDEMDELPKRSSKSTAGYGRDDDDSCDDPATAWNKQNSWLFDVDPCLAAVMDNTMVPSPEQSTHPGSGGRDYALRDGGNAEPDGGFGMAGRDAPGFLGLGTVAFADKYDSGEQPSSPSGTRRCLAATLDSALAALTEHCTVQGGGGGVLDESADGGPGDALMFKPEVELGFDMQDDRMVGSADQYECSASCMLACMAHRWQVVCIVSCDMCVWA